MRNILVIGLLLAVSGFTIDATLPDAAQEARAQNLFRQLKCVVCQGQPLSESDASIAQDMRKLIREKITAGATDRQIVDYLESRYGAEITTTPPLETDTLLLWLSPFLLLAAGLMFIVIRRR